MLPSQKDAKGRRRRKRFTNYVPEDFDQRVPFLVRKIEEEESEDDGKIDSLSEAVKIHWTGKGESEEEWDPSLDNLDDDLDDPLSSTAKPRKISVSTVEESVSLHSYVPEPEQEPEPEPIEEEKPKKKKDRKKKMEEPQEEVLEPEPILEVEPEIIYVQEVQREKSDLESNVETEWEPKSAVELDHGDEASNFSEDGELVVETEWEPKSAVELDHGDEASNFSEDGELVVETEEINIEMVEPQKGDETEEEEETLPSYTWLLGPTSDEIILSVVDFFCYIVSFVQNPIGFGNRTRKCCKKSKRYPTGSGDDSDKEKLE